MRDSLICPLVNSRVSIRYTIKLNVILIVLNTNTIFKSLQPMPIIVKKKSLLGAYLKINESFYQYI